MKSVCVCDASECVGAERTAAARDNLGRQLLDRHRLVALAADELCVRGGEKGVDEWLFPSAHIFATPPPRAKKRPRTHRVLLEVVTPSAVDQLLPEVLLEPAMRERAGNCE